MASSMTMKYYPEGDTLWLHLDPLRPAREAMTEYDFYVRYDTDQPDQIVGFKVLDFSHFIVHLYEPGVIPDMSLRFDVAGTDLKQASLYDVLEWAYRKYILQEQHITLHPAPVPLSP